MKLFLVPGGAAAVVFALAHPWPVPVVKHADVVGAEVVDGRRVVIGEVIEDGPYRTVVVYATADRAEWRRAIVPRPCDLDRNGWVNGDDADLFNAWFDAGDPRADFDGNGWVNGDDADAFAEAFQAGGAR